MICSIARCGQPAKVEITFVHSTRPVSYCQGHYLCPWTHAPWWDSKHIGEIRRVDIATRTPVR